MRTFNLEKKTYHPYKQPNDKLIYIDLSSNHPPQINPTRPGGGANRPAVNFRCLYPKNEKC